MNPHPTRIPAAGSTYPKGYHTPEVQKMERSWLDRWAEEDDLNRRLTEGGWMYTGAEPGAHMKFPAQALRVEEAGEA